MKKLLLFLFLSLMAFPVSYGQNADFSIDENLLVYDHLSIAMDQNVNFSGFDDPQARVTIADGVIKYEVVKNSTGSIFKQDTFMFKIGSVDGGAEYSIIHLVDAEGFDSGAGIFFNTKSIVFFGVKGMVHPVFETRYVQ